MQAAASSGGSLTCTPSTSCDPCSSHINKEEGIQIVTRLGSFQPVEASVAREWYSILRGRHSGPRSTEKGLDPLVKAVLRNLHAEFSLHATPSGLSHS